MARSSVYKAPRRRITFSASTPAPVGGLNTRDSPSLRGPSFADNLTNFIATSNGVAVRKGYRKYSIDVPGLVETLMPYSAAIGISNRMFAAWNAGASYGIADVTNPGSAIISGQTVQTGLTSAHWSHVNFTGAAGHYLVIANGVDPARHYNGMTWTTWTAAETANQPGLVRFVGGSTMTPSKLQSVISHQKRLWFVEANSTRAWYAPINSLGGDLNYFDFGALFPRGGKLHALTSWSVDGGTGMQNMLVAISSNGDAVIYEGTDPTNATTWKINGTWRLGKPVGIQPFQAFGGDVLLLSEDGLVPLSKFMQRTTTAPALSDTIRKTITDILVSQRELSGFQLQDYLTENLLIVNMPQINPMHNVQFIFNTITGGWSVFEGIPAQCWAIMGDTIYFGGHLNVYQGFFGYRDNAEIDGTGGNYYTAFGQQSQTNFDKPEKKQFVRAKVNIQSAVEAPSVLIDCNVDYEQDAPVSTGAVPPRTASAWGSGLWDEATWGSGTLRNSNEWTTLGQYGYSGAIVIAIPVQAETLWISTDWEIQLGENR